MGQVKKFILKQNLSYQIVNNSFDKQIKQMSTPLHHQPNNNTVKGNKRTLLLFNKIDLFF
jgi:hypothetical protein